MSKSFITNVDSDIIATLLSDPRWVHIELVLEGRIDKLTNRLTTAPLNEVKGLQARIAELRNLTRELENYKGGSD